MTFRYNFIMTAFVLPREHANYTMNLFVLKISVALKRPPGIGRIFSSGDLSFEQFMGHHIHLSNGSIPSEVVNAAQELFVEENRKKKFHNC